MNYAMRAPVPRAERPVRTRRSITVGTIVLTAAQNGGTMLSIIEWLQERHDNCVRIAAQKVGKDREGWVEDALYFELALKSIKAAEEPHV